MLSAHAAGECEQPQRKYMGQCDRVRCVTDTAVLKLLAAGDGMCAASCPKSKAKLADGTTNIQQSCARTHQGPTWRSQRHNNMQDASLSESSDRKPASCNWCAQASERRAVDSKQAEWPVQLASCRARCCHLSPPLLKRLLVFRAR
jgi:hypothetical protein